MVYRSTVPKTSLSAISEKRFVNLQFDSQIYSLVALAAKAETSDTVLVNVLKAAYINPKSNLVTELYSPQSALIRHHSLCAHESMQSSIEVKLYSNLYSVNNTSAYGWQSAPQFDLSTILS